MRRGRFEQSAADSKDGKRCHVGRSVGSMQVMMCCVGSGLFAVGRALVQVAGRDQLDWLESNAITFAPPKTNLSKARSHRDASGLGWKLRGLKTPRRERDHSTMIHCRWTMEHGLVPQTSRHALVPGTLWLLSHPSNPAHQLVWNLVFLAKLKSHSA